MTSISKNVYIDKLVNKSTINVVTKLVDVKPNTYILEKLILKILNLRLEILLEYKNISVPWTYAISNLKGEEIVGTFNEKKF